MLWPPQSSGWHPLEGSHCSTTGGWRLKLMPACLPAAFGRPSRRPAAWGPWGPVDQREPRNSAYCLPISAVLLTPVQGAVAATGLSALLTDLRDNSSILHGHSQFGKGVASPLSQEARLGKGAGDGIPDKTERGCSIPALETMAKYKRAPG